MTRDALPELAPSGLWPYRATRGCARAANDRPTIPRGVRGLPSTAVHHPLEARVARSGRTWDLFVAPRREPIERILSSGSSRSSAVSGSPTSLGRLAVEARLRGPPPGRKYTRVPEPGADLPGAARRGGARGRARRGPHADQQVRGLGADLQRVLASTQHARDVIKNRQLFPRISVPPLRVASCLFGTRSQPSPTVG